MTLRERIAPLIHGDVLDDFATRTTYSRDTSIFERTPAVVVFPRDAADVAAVVKFAHEAAANGEKISIAPRSAGSDMTGGTLTDSIAIIFTKYMNHIGAIDPDTVTSEPGVYYRDLEKATIAKTGALIPSYPASRELCAIGGMVGNNSGGELTLRYGKTSDWVRSLDVVLADGTKTTLRPLSPTELADKKSLDTLEGRIYRETDALLEAHADEVRDARPTVTKNSCGYPLWNIRRSDGTFDLTQLITGSQGTLGIVTSATIGTVKPPEHRAMLVVFLTDMKILPEVVERVLKHTPQSFESYDDQTFKLAVRFLPQILVQFGFVKAFELGFSFIPEAFMVMTGGVPKLILLAEFAEESPEAARKKAEEAKAALADMPVKTSIAANEIAAAKYWTIRRESFSLLRKNLHGLYAASFIEDIVVHPMDYPRFLPKLTAILEEYDLIYTIAGHIGDANFHIIPLVSLEKPQVRRAILELEDRVYALVASFHGSITGEHNDGIVRTPYIPLMYGDKMYALFGEVKKIFDPLGILNPGKKTGGTKDDIMRSMITKK